MLPTAYIAAWKAPKNDSKNADSKGVYGFFLEVLRVFFSGRL